jgi:hypothetical protein
MQDPAEPAVRIHGHALDKRVLSRLREMIRYCREKNHREMRWYYEAGRDFAAERIYGKLPPPPEYNLTGLDVSGGGKRPQDVVTRFPEGWTSLHAMARPTKMPLCRIVKRFSIPWKNNAYTYETLECQHILMAPVGYSVPAKSRRCPHCAIASAMAKKKPASTAAALSKAVSA